MFTKEERRSKLRPYVLEEFFSKRELFAFVALFITILFLLYPGWRFKEYLEKDPRANIQLRIKYLNALYRVDKKPEFGELLVESYIQAGKYTEALQTLEDMEKSAVDKLRISKLRYLLLKRLYFETLNDAYRKGAQSVLFEMARATDDYRLLQFIYEEGLKIRAPYASLEAGYRLAKLTKSLSWAEKAFNLAVGLKDLSKAKEVIDLVPSEDESSLLFKHKAYAQIGAYEEALRELLALMNKEPSRRVKDLDSLLWLATKSGKDPMTYLVEFIQQSEGREKKFFIMKAINYALGIKDIPKAKELIESYLTLYPNDPDYELFMVKSALATGDPYFASKVAEKIGRTRRWIE
mgnify:CR=1 FL=1